MAIARGKRLAQLWLALVVVAALAVATSALGAAPKPKPDLAIIALSNPPQPLQASFIASFRIDDLGKARARASTTRFYVSRDAGRSQDDIVVGNRKVAALAPRAHRSLQASLRIPRGTKPGKFFLLACADATGVVAESNEKNCRASKRPADLICSPGDNDCDGSLPPADCNDRSGAIRPGAPDEPDLRFVDSNCDGIDGNAAGAVFVAPTGDDADPGTMALPKRTFAAAIGAAVPDQKDVYAGAGAYAERLDVAVGVNVYGGYDAAWKRSLLNQTEITGATSYSTGPKGPVQNTVGALARNVTAATTLQLLRLAPGAPAGCSGASSYGLLGYDAGGLRIEAVTIQAAAGAAGCPGQNGERGRKGDTGKPGGGSRSNHSGGGGQKFPDGNNFAGGNGGSGGVELDHLDHGGDGHHGQLTSPDAFGLMGGDGGFGGAGDSEPEVGSAGYPGDVGVFRGDGDGGGPGNATPSVSSGSVVYWHSRPGDPGLRGSGGHGGGGGGGGGADPCRTCFDSAGGGGGGGAGGEGGGPGIGGTGGGGSFGIFIVNSPGALVLDSTVSAANGGAGGTGGGGALGGGGGPGGPGAAAEGDDARAGGAGGFGGAGNRGGDGGGGAGGPSVAIYGIPSSATVRTTVAHGSGGAGGAGGSGAGTDGGPGADGTAADYV